MSVVVCYIITVFIKKKENMPQMTKTEIVKKLLKQDLQNNAGEDLLELLIEKPITIDVDKEAEKHYTLGEKLADKMSEVAGSWTFIIFFGVFLATWILINVKFLMKAVDPYPFILLNLVLSCFAALQAPIIMMSQNRQAKKDSLRNQNDYQIDLKSELILEDLHKHVSILAKQQKKILEYIEGEEKKKSGEKN